MNIEEQPCQLDTSSNALNNNRRRQIRLKSASTQNFNKNKSFLMVSKKFDVKGLLESMHRGDDKTCTMS